MRQNLQERLQGTNTEHPVMVNTIHSPKIMMYALTIEYYYETGMVFTRFSFLAQK